ncbi:MAG: hypothetical protein ABJA82_01870 [Myxococcales bacterium]
MLGLHRLIVLLFRVIRFFDGIRRTREHLFSLLVTVPCSVVAAYLPDYVQFTDKVHFFGLTVVRDFHHQHAVYWLIVVSAIAYILERIVGGIAFPALSYLPWAVGTKALGFEAVTRNPDVALAWTTMLVNAACENRKRVRVICVGGKHLWSVAPVGVHSVSSAPLQAAREKGLVDAVMPTSDPNNPTVHQRFKTYSDAYKTQANFRTCSDLVSEMDDNKRTLLRSPGNTLVEHNILCMWRVVLTDEYCIVQNYFPNTEGSDSYKAPMFLFRKREPHKKTVKIDTYYDVFENMFRMISAASTSHHGPKDPTPSLNSPVTDAATPLTT